LLWIVAFPERIEAWGYPMAVALGLQKPVETTLGTKARIEYTALLAALAEDANAIANAFSREQKATLGTTDPRTPTQEAMWDTDPDNVAWKRQELERVRKLAEWHRDPDEVASEARDLRP
jgi:hypothetical protein